MLCLFHSARVPGAGRGGQHIFSKSLHSRLDLTLSMFVKAEGVDSPGATLAARESNLLLRDSERMAFSGKAFGVAQ